MKYRTQTSDDWHLDRLRETAHAIALAHEPTLEFPGVDIDAVHRKTHDRRRNPDPLAK